MKDMKEILIALAGKWRSEIAHLESMGWRTCEDNEKNEHKTRGRIVGMECCFTDLQAILNAHETQQHRCDGCKHWRRDADEGKGECVFNPPTIDRLYPNDAAWPVTEEKDHCSKWEAQP